MNSETNKQATEKKSDKRSVFYSILSPSPTASAGVCLS